MGSRAPVGPPDRSPTTDSAVILADVLAQITTSDWIASAVVFGIALVLMLGLRRLQRIMTRRVKIKDYTADMIRRALMGLIVLVTIFYLLDLLQLEAGPLLGGLGVSGIIVAIALQPVFGNFMGSMLLHGTKAFRPGDEILSNGIVGTVVDISHRAVEILDFDGNVVYIPNLKVLDSTLINLTADDVRRTILTFQVSYDTDLRVAQRVVREAVQAVDMVVATPATEILVVGFADSGVELEAQFWHPSEERSARWTVSEVSITIRETLAANEISIPFPHVVVQPGPGSVIDLSGGAGADGTHRAGHDTAVD